MGKLNRFFVGIGFFLLGLVACDRIPEGKYVIDYQVPGTEGEHRVLLEEYTGMRCVNCPAAARQVGLLAETFGSRLVTVAFHAGGFAVPTGIFQPDLRTEAGNGYFSHFGFDGTPVGMVNRTGALNADQWGAAVAKELEQNPVVVLKTMVAYDTTDRSYTAHLEMTTMSENRDYSLLLWLVEDSLVTPQVTPAGTERSYVQRHVFRHALNGMWGESLSSSFVGDSVFIKSNPFILPEEYDAKHCSVVFAVAETGNRRVVEVAQTELITEKAYNRKQPLKSEQ